MAHPAELPLIATDSHERADATRNRERILSTARRLFDERGVGSVSMDDVADAAGVGKGTLFRRFGSRAALCRAMLDESERSLQEGFIRGEPPLGPGAPPRERLIAFGEALLEMLDAHADLIAEAEVGSERFVSAPYGVHRLHVSLLLREADPDGDAELLAETLLAGLSGGAFLYLRQARGMSLERLKSGWSELVSRTVAAAAAVT